MAKFSLKSLVIIDNELFIILDFLENDKYLVQHFLNKRLFVVEEFFISNY